MLSKESINSKLKSKEISICPFDENSLGPVSYGLHLGDIVTIVSPSNSEYNGNTPRERTSVEIEIDDAGYLLPPKSFVIAKTLEKVTLTSHIVGTFDGKATLAQIGLFSHIASSLIEPDFNSNITCELFNSSDYPIRLYKGQKIGQISFSEAQ